MSPLDEALAFTFSEEGGPSNDPRDRGGSTGKNGLTEKTWLDFLRRHRLPVRSLASVTDLEFRMLAIERFWVPAGCDDLAPPASTAHFDFAWNSGPAHAVKLLQAVLGITVDGDFGRITRAAANQRFPLVLAHDLVTARRGYHVKDTIDTPEERAFIRGWLARCDRLDGFIARTETLG